MNLTTSEVAGLLGVSERTVRRLAASGALTPTPRRPDKTHPPGRPPLLFDLDAVAEYEYHHRPASEAARIARLAEEWAGSA